MSQKLEHTSHEDNLYLSFDSPKTNNEADKEVEEIMNTTCVSLLPETLPAEMCSTPQPHNFSNSSVMPVSDRLRENLSVQLQVKQVSKSSSQAGVFLPKYLTRPESKCIMCSTCSIVFSGNAFLTHCHDQYGKKIPCERGEMVLSNSSPSNTEKLLFATYWEQIKSNLDICPQSTSSSLNSMGKDHFQNRIDRCESEIETSRIQESEKPSSAFTTPDSEQSADNEKSNFERDNPVFVIETVQDLLKVVKTKMEAKEKQSIEAIEKWKNRYEVLKKRYADLQARVYHLESQLSVYEERL